jgi:peptide deformylase
MIREIIQIGDDRLEKKSIEVDPTTKETKAIVQDLLDTLNNDPEKSAGISAPQIGINKRVVVCRRVDKEQDGDKPLWEPMINPVIISSSEKISTYWEGCLSIKSGDLFGEVKRPERVTVIYKDTDGNDKKIKASGYFSHVVQHEVDHINGVLFLSYVKDPSKLYNSKQLDVLEESDDYEE